MAASCSETLHGSSLKLHLEDPDCGRLPDVRTILLSDGFAGSLDRSSTGLGRSSFPLELFFPVHLPSFVYLINHVFVFHPSCIARLAFLSFSSISPPSSLVSGHRVAHHHHRHPYWKHKTPISRTSSSACSPPSQLSLYRFPALRHKSCITPLCSRTHPGVRAGFRWLIHTIFALLHTSLDFSVSPLSWVHRIGPLGWCLSTPSIEYGRQAL